MNIFLRIILAIYAFFLTIISGIIMLIPFKKDILDRIYYSFYDILKSNYSTFILLLITFVFFALSLTFLLSGFKNDKDKKSVSKHTNIGEIKISLNSIESIALAAAKRINGVKDTKATIINHNDTVSITVKAIVMSDVNIPTLSENLQLMVKKTVEDTAGINVSDVRVVVDNIYTAAAYKPRVE